MYDTRLADTSIKLNVSDYNAKL